MKKTIVLLLTAAVFPLFAADIYVDYTKGDKNNPGTKNAPLGRFSQAIAKAKPGDTIYILPNPTPIRDMIRVKNVSGAPGKPITVDAMNNIFIGTEPLNDKEWKEISPGVFSCKRKMGYNYASRFYFVNNGKINRMGRFTKSVGGKGWKNPEKLNPGEWTITDTWTGPKASRPRMREFIFTVRLPEGAKTLADSGIEEVLPHRGNGIGINGESSWINFRNVIVKNFINDGYNIHHNIRNVRFDNIAAVDCGDDGISAHETALIYIKNFVSIGNSTAACHIQQAECHHENIYAEKTLGKDISMHDSVNCTFKNVWINGDAFGGSALYNRKNENIKCSFENVNIFNRQPGKKAVFEIKTAGKAEFSFKNTNLANYVSVTPFEGINVVKDEKEKKAMQEKLAEVRKEMFALFGGNLEKALK